MSKFKPGAIVYYVDHNVLYQAIVCVEPGRFPITAEDQCIVYNISPDTGSTLWSEHNDGHLFCDIVTADLLFATPEEAIKDMKEELKREYLKKVSILDAYAKGSNKEKQMLAGKVKDIFLGHNIED